MSVFNINVPCCSGVGNIQQRTGRRGSGVWICHPRVRFWCQPTNSAADRHPRWRPWWCVPPAHSAYTPPVTPAHHPSATGSATNARPTRFLLWVQFDYVIIYSYGFWSYKVKFSLETWSLVFWKEWSKKPINAYETPILGQICSNLIVKLHRIPNSFQINYLDP